MTHWVCKSDGRIQCQDEPEIPLSVMHAQLAAIVGEQNILSEKKISVIVPTLCGIPAGTMNAYELSDAGYFLLFHGFIGQMGFRDCPGDGEPAMRGVSDQEGAAAGLAAGIALTGITSAAHVPTLVRELIGHRMRVYEQGAAITMDLVPSRVNIVTKSRNIVDVWFG